MPSVRQTLFVDLSHYDQSHKFTVTKIRVAEISNIPCLTIIPNVNQKVVLSPQTGSVGVNLGVTLGKSHRQKEIMT